ncbi:nucleotidyltransferase family protein [Vibrio campbellii]
MPNLNIACAITTQIIFNRLKRKSFLTQIKDFDIVYFYRSDLSSES